MTDDLSDGQIWILGDKAGRSRQKPAIGRADLDVAIVQAECHLRVVYDVPPRRHALLVNWPGEVEKQKHIAQLLAQKAVGVPR